MVDKYEKEKKKQLGMSSGNAKHILSRKIIFSLLKEQTKNICYRCNKEIKSYKTLSIDHKKDWLHSKNAKKLFFDIKNVKFSHIKCNRPRTQLQIITGKIKYKGVHKCKNKTNPYRSEIKLDGKKTHVGYFKTAKDAAIEYDKHITKILGKAATTNKKLSLL